MEDKTYDLLAKMYSEFSEFKNEFQDLQKNVARIDIKLEHDIEPKILFYLKTGILLSRKLMSLPTGWISRTFDISVIKGGKPKASKG